MTDICDYKIAQDMGASCENPSIAGLKNKGYLINYDDVDWDNVEYDSTNKNIVTSLPLKSGARAYAVYMPGKTPFTGTQKSLVESTYRNKFEKIVKLVILDNGPAVSKNVIDPLANGKFVAVLENEFQGVAKNNTFEIFGLEQGLSAQEMTDEKYSEETDGGWVVSLREQNAPTSGLYLFDSSVTATRALLENMLTA